VCLWARVSVGVCMWSACVCVGRVCVGMCVRDIYYVELKENIRLCNYTDAFLCVNEVQSQFQVTVLYKMIDIGETQISILNYVQPE